jgi:hypothetical protein
VRIAFRRRDRLIFLHMFAKSEKANLSDHEMRALQSLADIYMAFTPERMSGLMQRGVLLEITRP